MEFTDEEKICLSRVSMGLMDEEKMRNVVDAEMRRLEAEMETTKLAVDEQIRKNKKLTEEELDEVRDMRMKFVNHMSVPLEIIEKGDDDFIDVIAENVNQIELVIHIIYHDYIYQYWNRPPRSSSAAAAAAAADAATTNSSLLCQQHHHDYHHPRDDDDEDMVLTSCRPLGDPPQTFKIILGQGLFAAAAAAAAAAMSDDHIMSNNLLGGLDVLLERNILYKKGELEDLKTSIIHSISQAKAQHILMREKQQPLPKRVRICFDVSRIAKKYFGSVESATFAAAEDDFDAATASYASLSYTFN